MTGTWGACGMGRDPLLPGRGSRVTLATGERDGPLGVRSWRVPEAGVPWAWLIPFPLWASVFSPAEWAWSSVLCASAQAEGLGGDGWCSVCGNAAMVTTYLAVALLAFGSAAPTLTQQFSPGLPINGIEETRGREQPPHLRKPRSHAWSRPQLTRPQGWAAHSATRSRDPPLCLSSRSTLGLPSHLPANARWLDVPLRS